MIELQSKHEMLKTVKKMGFFSHGQFHINLEATRAEKNCEDMDHMTQQKLCRVFFLEA